MADETVALAVKAAKDARRAMLFTMFAVAVAILVLAIDNSIKRNIVSEAQRIRGEIGRWEEEMASGVQAAHEDGTGASPPDGAVDAGGGGVATGARARTPVDGDAGAGKPAKTGRGGGGSARP